MTPPDEVIDGFPEFSDDIEKVKDPKDAAAEQKAKTRLRALAKRIVTSRKGGRRIVGFVVHGHSDQTVRMKAGAERDQFEQGISEDRAENCKKLLIQMIKEEGGEPFIAGIEANATTRGFGSKHRIFIPANTTPQMEKNRRVEIFLREFVDPPPQPPPPPRPQPKPDVGSNWSIQILSGSTLSVASPIPFTDVLGSFTVTLNFEVIDKDRKRKAKYQYIGTGASVGVGIAIGASASVTVTQGSKVDFQTTKGSDLSKFVGDADVAQEPGAGVSVLATGGDFNFDFTEMGKIGTLVKGKSTLPVGAGQGFSTLPSASVGGATTGKIVMIGGIQNL